jgi:hypothetical protein
MREHDSYSDFDFLSVCFYEEKSQEPSTYQAESPSTPNLRQLQPEEAVRQSRRHLERIDLRKKARA